MGHNSDLMMITNQEQVFLQLSEGYIIRLYVLLSIYMETLSVYLSVCLSFCLSVCLSISPSVHPTLVTTLQPSIFNWSRSCLVQPLIHQNEHEFYRLWVLSLYFLGSNGTLKFYEYIDWLASWTTLAMGSCPLMVFLAGTKQLYEWYFLSVCLSVCLSARHTFLTMFPSSHHHEIFRSYHHGPG